MQQSQTTLLTSFQYVYEFLNTKVKGNYENGPNHSCFILICIHQLVMNILLYINCSLVLVTNRDRRINGLKDRKTDVVKK